MTDAMPASGFARGRRAWVLVGTAVLAVVLVAAVLVQRRAGSGGSEHPIVHLQGDGPLAARIGAGGQSNAIPPRNPIRWSSTFGSIFPCSTEAGSEITIDAVRFDADPEPVKLAYWFRLTPEAAQQVGDPDGWTPIGSIGGTHGHYGNWGPVRGTFVRALSAPITQDCAEVGSSSARTELLTEMTVDKHGGWVHETYIDYHVGDQAYTLVIPWDNVMCGDQITEGDWC